MPGRNRLIFLAFLSACATVPPPPATVAETGCGRAKLWRDACEVLVEQGHVIDRGDVDTGELVTRPSFPDDGWGPGERVEVLVGNDCSVTVRVSTVGAVPTTPGVEVARRLERERLLVDAIAERDPR